mmetsp:Transcript_24032/g.55489  ORF Transcript_24032/g.55489 Transcript_24032/m.55489 type:complete len:355 (-) Transcript_24032:51-1115(-)
MLLHVRCPTWWLVPLFAWLSRTHASDDIVTLRMYSHKSDVLECLHGVSMEGVSVSPERCQMGFNFTCGCDGEKKVLVGEKYFPSCTDRQRTSAFSFAFGECLSYSSTQEIMAEDNGACPSCCPCDSSECTIFGDPHVKVFDQQDKIALLALTRELQPRRVMQAEAGNTQHSRKFGWGDFWLVKSDLVKIQGRYRKVFYPKAKHPLNATYLTGIAIGGPFLAGHTLLLAPREHQVVWKGPDFREEILSSFPAAFSAHVGGDSVMAQYHNKTKLVKDPQQTAVGIDIQLPSCVSLTLNRWKKHLDVTMTMPATAGGTNGMDGQCGNYNADPLDDSASLIDMRMGYHIPHDELLFED